MRGAWGSLVCRWLADAGRDRRAGGAALQVKRSALRADCPAVLGRPGRRRTRYALLRRATLKQLRRVRSRSMPVLRQACSPAALRSSALHRRAAPPAQRPRPAWWWGDCCRGSWGRNGRRGRQRRRRAHPDLLLSPLGRGRVRGCATVDSVRRRACRAAPIPAFPQRGKEQDRSVAGGLTERPTNAALTLERLAAPGRARAICGAARSAAGPACPREVARASWTDSLRLFERSAAQRRAVSYAARRPREHRSGVGARRRPPRYEPASASRSRPARARPSMPTVTARRAPAVPATPAASSAAAPHRPTVRSRNPSSSAFTSPRFVSLSNSCRACGYRCSFTSCRPASR